jgi:hypothetical protein
MAASGLLGKAGITAALGGLGVNLGATTIGEKKKEYKNFNVAITNNTIRFSLRLPNNSTINLYSPNGKIVYSSKIAGNSHRLQNMAKGIYLLRINNDKTVIHNQKVMF